MRGIGRDARSNVVAALQHKDSMERRLVASLCYDLGVKLTQKFRLATVNQNPADHRKKDQLRKLAQKSFWEYLTNLHPFADVPMSMGGRNVSFKAACCAMVSMAIANKCKKSTQS